LTVLAGGAASEPWTEPEIRDRRAQQIYHWGQKGEAQPNNGWSNYAQLIVDLGGDNYLQFDRHGSELLAALHAREDDARRFGAFNIPGAGLFYAPDDGTPCATDAIEELGLHAELALHYLARAFPSGPAALAGGARATATARGGPEQVRFMQRALDRPDDWQVEVTVTRIDADHLRAEFGGANAAATAIVEWYAKAQGPSVDDIEPLAGWQACWSNAPRHDGAGALSTAIEPSKRSNIHSFGDLRRALNPHPGGNR
jgi:hypothetical protein